MKEIAVLSLQSAQDMVRGRRRGWWCPSRVPTGPCKGDALYCDALNGTRLPGLVSSQIEDRKNSFEIYGYDFMIDSNYCPWLIEINSSPDFSYSTEVTKTLVKEASEDIVKVIVDYRWASDCGERRGKDDLVGVGVARSRHSPRCCACYWRYGGRGAARSNLFIFLMFFQRVRGVKEEEVEAQRRAGHGAVGVRPPGEAHRVATPGVLIPRLCVPRCGGAHWSSTKAEVTDQCRGVVISLRLFSHSCSNAVSTLQCSNAS